MAEDIIINLKKSDLFGYGFSLLSTKGLPHIIYDIVDKSPAAEPGAVEAGDVIIKINDVDVDKYSTKEVLKCLRLSHESVTLQLRRDPQIKAKLRKYLQQKQNTNNPDIPVPDLTSFNQSAHINRTTNFDTLIGGSEKHSSTYTNLNQKYIDASKPSRIPTAVRSPLKSVSPQQSPVHSTSSQTQNRSHIPLANGASVHYQENRTNESTPSIVGQQSAPKARFEAYMMTGDLMLNLSSTPQTMGILSVQNKKVDSLCDNNIMNCNQRNGLRAPKATGESSPSSTSLSDENSAHSIKSTIRLNEKSDIPKSKLRRYNHDRKYSCEAIKGHESEMNNINKQNEIEFNERGDGTSLLSSSSSGNEQSSQMIKLSSMSNGSPKTPNEISASENKNMPKHNENSFGEEDVCQSVPTSPATHSTTCSEKLSSKQDAFISMPNSPEPGDLPPEVIYRIQQRNGIRKCDSNGFRTSRSEDHLQDSQRSEGDFGTIAPTDMDEDRNSSVNALLDTRQDSEDSQNSNGDRIVWSYNAPIQTLLEIQRTANSSFSNSISSTPQRSDSPASPTSVSSSIMSSTNSSSKSGSGTATRTATNNTGASGYPMQYDQNTSEAVSNISSPDYQDDDYLLSSKDMGMAISDPSDSDSTIMVSESRRDKHKKSDYNQDAESFDDEFSTPKESEDDLIPHMDDQKFNEVAESSPPVSDDGSDVESLHSFHYSPKAVDYPSAVRLAKRLYSLDGFKKSDVSRHLSKNNDFSKAVAEEYLKYFNFEKKSLDESLRIFLRQFSLSGETQERERVLVHFSKRYLDCNPGSFNSPDAVHTLTCAIMLLNTDLHGPNIGPRMTCVEFIDNLEELNDGDNFPRDILKHLYHAIKNHPLEWALDEEVSIQPKGKLEVLPGASNIGDGIDLNTNIPAVEYKKGYVMRKCCYESNHKKTPFGKRSWKMFYCTIRDLGLFLHKDENGFKKNQMSDNAHNSIRIHHSLATRADDYTKKQFVFRLQTADQSEYLFQTSDTKELQSWIDTINYVSAAFSAPPLEGGVGSQKRFQRPLLPVQQTKLLLQEQLRSHEARVNRLEAEINEHKIETIPSKGLPLQNYREKDAYLHYELNRYKTYISILQTKTPCNTTHGLIVNQ